MKLPSGREIELGALTYGDVRDAEDAQYESGKRGSFLFYDLLMQRLAGLSAAEIRALSPADGQALFNAAVAAREGRPVEAEGPFETSSSSASETTQE